MTGASATEITFRAGLMDATRPVPDALTDGAGRPAGRRFDVYRNNVAVSLREALETGFPAVAKLIGPENFSRAAGMYLRAAPPDSPVMMHYGTGFPAFLAGIEALRGIGYLPCVARLELALRASYHAADAPVLDAARLAALDEDSLMRARLTVAPATRVLRSPWPVRSIHRYALIPGSPKPQARAEDVVVTRPAFDPATNLLPPGGADFLTTLQGGGCFGDALAAAGTAFDLSATLSLLLQQGAFSDLTRA